MLEVGELAKLGKAPSLILICYIRCVRLKQTPIVTHFTACTCKISLTLIGLSLFDLKFLPNYLNSCFSNRLKPKTIIEAITCPSSLINYKLLLVETWGYGKAISFNTASLHHTQSFIIFPELNDNVLFFHCCFWTRSTISHAFDFFFFQHTLTTSQWEPCAVGWITPRTRRDCTSWHLAASHPTADWA